MCKELETLADFYGACIVDYDFHDSIRGAYYDGVIAVNRNINSIPERRCIIACELGRHIMRNNKSIILTDEYKDITALHWAVTKLMPLHDIAMAYEHGANTPEEYAEYLGITTQFLASGIDFYRKTFGYRILQDGIIIDLRSCRLKCEKKAG